MRSFDDFKARALSDPAVRETFGALAPEFELHGKMIQARQRVKLTQEDVAQRMETSRSFVTRLETSKEPPSLRSLQRFAKAVDCKLEIRFVPQK